MKKKLLNLSASMLGIVVVASALILSLQLSLEQKTAV